MGRWREDQCEPWKGLQQDWFKVDCSSSPCCVDSGPEFTLGNIFKATNARVREGDLRPQRRKDSRFGTSLAPSLLDFRALVPARTPQDV